MTGTRTGDPFMSAGEYGRAMPQFSVNLLVRNMEDSVRFQPDFIGVKGFAMPMGTSRHSSLTVGPSCFTRTTLTITIHPICDCRKPACADVELNSASLASIPTQSSNAPEARAQLFCSHRRIIPTAGVKLAWPTLMDTSGP